MGFAIAAELDDSLPSVDGFDASAQQSISRISDCLKDAKIPLLVSGTGSQNLAVIQAASAIANALQKTVWRQS